MKQFTAYYMTAHKARRQWANWKWRLFVVLLVAAILTLIYDHLHQKYAPYVVQVLYEGAWIATEFTLVNKLFAWFVTGILFGIVFVVLMFEGEFLINLRKIGLHVEKEAEKAVRGIERGIEHEIEEGFGFESKKAAKKTRKARRKRGRRR